MRRIQSATEVFGYKWHPVIIYAVYELESAGYSEIEAALDGISSKMLSDGLSDLCDRNLLETTESVEDSGRTIYILSDKGRALVPALDVLDAWNQHYNDDRSSVLILENERMVASMLADYFSDLYTVHYARTGKEAVEKHTDDVDLVIIDRKLDGMSGDDAAARIRAEHERQLILFVSGVEPGDDLCELACDDYIHKPVKEDEMKTRVELLLDRAELDATAREYLSLRSKQVALIEVHGRAATKMGRYQNCTTKIDELDLSSDQQQTLEPLLPPAPNAPFSTGE